METQELDLVTLAQKGDESAFGALFEKHQNGVYNFACSLLKNPEDAKDVTQEAFIKTFAALPKLRDTNGFSSYLYKTARNLAYDELKHKSRFASPEPLETAEEPYVFADPQRSLLIKEQQSRVRTVANSLPDDYRAVLYLREIQEMPYDEISRTMGMPKSSVGVLLLRARLKFRQEYRMSQIDPDQLAKECRGMLPLLSAYIDDELPDDKKELVEQHLEACPLCRLAVDEMTEASKSYRALIPLIPPAIIKKNVLDEVKNFLPYGPIKQILYRFSRTSAVAKRTLAGSVCLLVIAGVFTGLASYPHILGSSSSQASKPKINESKTLKAPSGLNVFGFGSTATTTPAASASDSSSGSTGSGTLNQKTTGTTNTGGGSLSGGAGTGTAPSPPSVCATCGGSGKITCWNCGGLGYRYTNTLCPQCGGTGTVLDYYDYIEGVWTHKTCPYCGGSGHIYIVPCDVCWGARTIPCPTCSP